MTDLQYIDFLRHILQVAQENAPAAEYGSAQVWGSKKSNMNHLLNFHFESRDYRDHHHGDGRRGVRRAAGCSVPYNKERFLQAKYVYWECWNQVITRPHMYRMHGVRR